MSHTQIHALIGFLAGLGAIAIDWAIGALSNHTVSLPVGLTVATPLVVALLTYGGTALHEYLTALV